MSQSPPTEVNTIIGRGIFNLVGGIATVLTYVYLTSSGVSNSSSKGSEKKEKNEKENENENNELPAKECHLFPCDSLDELYPTIQLMCPTLTSSNLFRATLFFLQIFNNASFFVGIFDSLVLMPCFYLCYRVAPHVTDAILVLQISKWMGVSSQIRSALFLLCCFGDVCSGLNHYFTLKEAEDNRRISSQKKVAQQLRMKPLLKNLRTLEGSMRLLGVTHCHTLEALETLTRSALKLIQKGIAEDESMYRLLFVLHQQILGVNHKDTLKFMNIYGVSLVANGNLEAAKPLIQRSLECHETFYGVKHPKTLISVHNMGWLLMQQQNPKAAQKFFQRTLEGEEILYGLCHKSVLNTTGWLQRCLKEQGKWVEAEILRSRISAAKKAVAMNAATAVVDINALALDFQMLKIEIDYNKLQVVSAVIKIQYVARKCFHQKRNSAALTIQSNYRGQKRNSAALMIQFNYRGWCERYQNRNLAALMIQSNYRGWCERYQKRNLAAVMIQSNYRGCCARIAIETVQGEDEWFKLG